MKNEEAVRILRNPEEIFYSGDQLIQTKDAIEIAKIIEKQVTKEVTNGIIINGIILGGNCPNCGHEIGITAYCGYCGQSIKWVNPIHKNGVR